MLGGLNVWGDAFASEGSSWSAPTAFVDGMTFADPLDDLEPDPLEDLKL